MKHVGLVSYLFKQCSTQAVPGIMIELQFLTD